MATVNQPGPIVYRGEVGTLVVDIVQKIPVLVVVRGLPGSGKVVDNDHDVFQ